MFLAHLYRLADEKYLLVWTRESGWITKAATAKFAHLILLTYAGLGKLDEGKDSSSNYFFKEITSSDQVNIQRLAKQLQHMEHIFVIGRGISYPVHLNSAQNKRGLIYSC